MVFSRTITAFHLKMETARQPSSLSFGADRMKDGRQFTVSKTLGEGTHGKVVLAVDSITDKEVALKLISKNSLLSDKEKKHLRREIDIMSQLHHPHVISVYEVFDTEKEVVLVMEYANGGELFDHVNSSSSSNSTCCSDISTGGLCEHEAKKIFRQLVSAVHYLHKNGIVHRDLKLENVLLDSNHNAKLADFGLSTTFQRGQLLQTYCGSPLYASPEIVNGIPYHGPEVDCWSLGVMLYAMVYGVMPFDGHDIKTLRKQISGGLINQPSVFSSAHDLILDILNQDRSHRADLCYIASHWWLNDADDDNESDISDASKERWTSSAAHCENHSSCDSLCNNKAIEASGSSEIINYDHSEASAGEASGNGFWTSSPVTPSLLQAGFGSDCQCKFSIVLPGDVSHGSSRDESNCNATCIRGRVSCDVPDDRGSYLGSSSRLGRVGVDFPPGGSLKYGVNTFSSDSLDELENKTIACRETDSNRNDDRLSSCSSSDANSNDCSLQCDSCDSKSESIGYEFSDIDAVLGKLECLPISVSDHRNADSSLSCDSLE